MTCMHVKVFMNEYKEIFLGVYAVLRKEFTSQGVFIHICDEFGRFIDKAPENCVEFL